MNSDEIVEALQPYGVVAIFQNDESKLFSADAHLFLHGMKAKVHSGFRHPTMLSALAALHTNVMAVVVQPEPTKTLLGVTK